MKFRVFPFLLLLALFGITVPVAAHGDGGYGPMHGPRWGDRRELPPDERREMRQQMREHWRQERPPHGEGPRWRGMEPDERLRLRDEMREHRSRFEGSRRPGGGPVPVPDDQP
jgi:hypothetical protein